MTSSPISKSIVTNSQTKKILEVLKNGLLEKDETVALSLLAAISGESIFLLGQPGVAKSMIARRLKSAFKDATAFEYLMNRFSTPEDIFGPIDIQELKKGNHQRKAEGYLPTASIAFLDEIWKAGPAIQNTLLTIINERIFRNGTTEEKVPLKTLIAASNELPAPNEGLEALWDRFLIRLEVKGIEATENFDALLTKPIEGIKVEEADKISDEQYTATQDAIANITLPENILAIIHSIRNAIIIYNEQHIDTPIYISDRRWLKIARILRTSALLHNRKEVDLMDCFLMVHCLWSNDEQRVYLLDKISGLLRKEGYTTALDLEKIEEEFAVVKEDVDKETKKQAKVQDHRPICENDQYTFKYENTKYQIEVSEYNTLGTSPKDINVTYEDHYSRRKKKNYRSSRQVMHIFLLITLKLL